MPNLTNDQKVAVMALACQKARGLTIEGIILVYEKMSEVITKSDKLPDVQALPQDKPYERQLKALKEFVRKLSKLIRDTRNKYPELDELELDWFKEEDNA